MKVFNLPNDIFSDKEEAASDIIIHNYTADKESFRERSVLHTHAVSLVIKGEKTMHFAGQQVSANDKDFHFLSAGNCIATMDLSRQDFFSSILIFFNERVLADFMIKNNNLVRQLSSTCKTTFLPYFSLQKDAFIYNYMASLQLILNSKGKLSQAMKRLKLEELLLYLLEQHPATILSFHAAQKNMHKDIGIRQVVESNITSTLTIDELAFLCNTSPSTFKRNFARIYNTSPINWFLEQRMKIAADLLLQHNAKPGDIFHKIGYENHSSFTKSFRKFYGVSPREFQIRKLTVQEQ